MLASHTIILKANKGEVKALTNLDGRTARRVLPLFEVGILTDAVRESKYMKASQTPTLTYLNRKLDPISGSWSAGPVMVDGYQWAADSRVENGDHVIAYMVSRLRASGVSVIPVVGYDRWGSVEYRQGLKSIPPRGDGNYCLRLDSSAIEDAAEPGHFQDTIADIIDELGLDPARCFALLDFADISMATMPVEFLVSKAGDMIRQLQSFGFHHYVVAGCSFPSTINLAVSDRDSIGSVLRKEMLLWQTLRLELPEVVIGYGDYGVRGPATTEQPSKFTNGKIRHTVKLQTFVVRGHPFTNDRSFVQMYGLAATVIGSLHFLGEDFSWGDRQILLCSRQQIMGNLSDWIAIDTNHHLTFVVQEVEEFERARVSTRAEINM